MKKETTKYTENKAKSLSIFIFGYITQPCEFHISKGEEAARNWIKAIEKRYNVIA